MEAQNDHNFCTISNAQATFRKAYLDMVYSIFQRRQIWVCPGTNSVNKPNPKSDRRGIELGSLWQ